MAEADVSKPRGTFSSNCSRESLLPIADANCCSPKEFDCCTENAASPNGNEPNFSFEPSPKIKSCHTPRMCLQCMNDWQAASSSSWVLSLRKSNVNRASLRHRKTQVGRVFTFAKKVRTSVRLARLSSRRFTTENAARKSAKWSASQRILWKWESLQWAKGQAQKKHPREKQRKKRTSWNINGDFPFILSFWKNGSRTRNVSPWWIATSNGRTAGIEHMLDMRMSCTITATLFGYKETFCPRTENLLGFHWRKEICSNLFKMNLRRNFKLYPKD